VRCVCPKNKLSKNNQTNKQNNTLMATRDTSDADARISKKMSYILRHHATEVGLEMRGDGSVRLTELMKLKQFKGVSRSDIHRVVASESSSLRSGEDYSNN
jgi:RNA:NAD 2'-phosphotransferase (TPT1/KptA family)